MIWLALLKHQLARVRALFRADQIRGEIDDEMRFHLEQRAADEQRRGVAPEVAHATAHRRFGHVASIREAGYDVRGGGWIETTMQDVTYALRALRKNFVFAATVALTLSLGIGANCIVFSVVEHVLLRPLQLPHPERVFAVRARTPRESSGLMSAPEFYDLAAGVRSFDAIGAVIPHFSLTWTGDGEARTVWAAAISPGFFASLGVRPLLGREYTTPEYHLDGVYAIVSHRFWQSKLAGDPNVLGRTIHLGGSSETIIGVMPDVPDVLPGVDVWQTLVPDFEFMRWRDNRFLTVIGRLKSGLSPLAAGRELTSILQRGPGESSERAIVLVPLKDDVVGSVHTELLILMAAVALVLLVTCVNVSMMLLARMSARRLEVAVRVSLGARWSRLVRQFATENLVLVALGATAGVVAALATSGAVARYWLTRLPRAGDARIDTPVLVFTIGLTVALVLSLSAITGYGVRRIDLVSALRTGRVGGHERGGLRLLVAMQAACAMALLVAAGLLLHSFVRLQEVDPGFDPRATSMVSLRTTESTRTAAYFDRILEAVSGIPGVSEAAVADCIPGSRTDPATLAFRDRPMKAGAADVAETCWISPRYFATLRAEISRGRQFTMSDDEHAPPVAIVNASMVKRYWPRESPIGKDIAVTDLGLGREKPDSLRFRRIVGVVRDVKQETLDKPTVPVVYLPFHQDESGRAYRLMFLFARTRFGVGNVGRAIQAMVRSVNPDQPVAEPMSMEAVLSTTLVDRRLEMLTIGCFAALAIVLCATGLYGMMAYSLAQRRREFSVRIAVGATRYALVGMVLSDGLRLVGAGLVGGALAAIALGRAMTAMLFGIGPLDVWAFTLSACTLALVGVVASWLPAWRASSIDPARVLRGDS
jgi:predicted permease